MNYFDPNHQATSPAGSAYSKHYLLKDYGEVAMRGDIMLSTGDRVLLLNLLLTGVTWLITQG